MDQNSIRIIIADGDPIDWSNLKKILWNRGYAVIAEVSDGFDVVESCRLHHPDLVIVDIDLPLLDGISAVKMIHKEELAEAVLILTHCRDWNMIEQAKAYGASGYLMKPAEEKSLIPSIELAAAHGKEINRLRKDIEKMSDQLETRTMIEKAKGLVMHERNMTDQQAYNFIKKISQTKNLPMRRVAQILLVKNEE